MDSSDTLHADGTGSLGVACNHSCRESDDDVCRQLIQGMPVAVIATGCDFTIKSWNLAAAHLFGWTAQEAHGQNLFELVMAGGRSLSRERLRSLEAGEHHDAEEACVTRRGDPLRLLFQYAPWLDGGIRRGYMALPRETGRAAHQAAEPPQHTGRSTEMLYEVVEKLLEGGNAQNIIQDLCVNVMRHLGCDVFFHYLISKAEPDWMHLSAYSGVSEDQIRDVRRLACKQAVSGAVADTGCRMVIENVQSSADARASLVKCMGVRAYACYPLMIRDEVLGTLSFGTRSRDYFLASDLALMRAVSGHVAVAVNRLRVESNLMRLAEELQEKNKLVTDFFTNISHEFKTPLSIILVDLQLMEYRLRTADAETREKLGKMTTVMRQNALRLLRLIGNLLDVTKIDAGFMKARLISIDIVSLVADLVSSVSDYAENAGISLHFTSSRPSRYLPADGEKVERIILNLLSNAIKYTEPGGHIEVSLLHDRDAVTISVRDDGEGIPDDKKELIFDRFRQVNTSLTRSSEGCGIGLSLTKALVELLHGKIWFESCKNCGSEFFVELPVLQENTLTHSAEIEGMPRSRKVEMEFADIHKAGRQKEQKK